MPLRAALKKGSSGSISSQMLQGPPLNLTRKEDKPQNFKNKVSISSNRKALKYLRENHNTAIMMNYESLLLVKNPCDFAVAWKAGYPE